MRYLKLKIKILNFVILLRKIIYFKILDLYDLKNKINNKTIKLF